MMVYTRHRKEEEQKRKMAVRQRADEDETNVALRRKLEDNRQERERLKQSQTMKAQATKKPAAYKVTNADTTDQVRNPKQKNVSLSVAVGILPDSSLFFFQKHVSQKSWEEMEKRLEGYIERLEKHQSFNP